MKFKLSNLDNSIDVGDQRYEKFKKYGFTFEEGYYKGNVLVNQKEVEINSIQELMKIIEYFENSVIVDTDTITIYDSYNE